MMGDLYSQRLVHLPRIDQFPALGVSHLSSKFPLAPGQDASNSSQFSHAALLKAPSKAQSMAHKPAMSHELWRELSQRTPCMKDFKLGPAPAPLAFDTYADKWLKLVWMEEYCSMLQFMQEFKHLSANPAHFNQDASLSIKVNHFDQEQEAYRVTVRGTDPSRDFALPDDMALPGDFAKAIFKLPGGSGWLYLRQIFAEDNDDNKTKIQEGHDVSTKKLLKSMQARSAGGKQEKMEALAEIYTENFDEVLGSLPPAWRQHRRCILFDSFSTCTRRFEALHKYPKVNKELRKHIEASSWATTPPVEMRPLSGRKTHSPSSPAEPEYHGPLLRPVPSSGSQVASTKLNEVQHSILESLKSPVDFVQGPPGTGKSFFTVELLRTRIPPNRKVLLCTTTNKAIDSLAEKICVTCGHDAVVAIGNPHRLGATSVTLTLDEKVKRHRSKRAWLEMCVKATYVMEAYTNIQQDALTEARKKDQEESKGASLTAGVKYSVNEAQVAASMAVEMSAAARAAEEVARVKLAASSLGGRGRQGRGFQGGVRTTGKASQAAGSNKHPDDDASDDEQEAGDMRDMKALTETSQGVLSQKVRPHIRSLKRMLQAVQNAAKKFVAETDHPEIVLGWIWNLLPEMDWFLTMKLRVSVGLLEEFKLFSSNVLVLNSSTVDKLLRLHFLRTSRYVVCTAASAANLSARVERDIGSIRKGLMESALDSFSVLRILACECSTCKSCDKPTCRPNIASSGNSSSTADASTAGTVALSTEALNATDQSSCSLSHTLQGHEAPQLLKKRCEAGLGNESAAAVRARKLCERTHGFLAQLGNLSITGDSRNAPKPIGCNHERPSLSSVLELSPFVPSSAVASVSSSGNVAAPAKQVVRVRRRTQNHTIADTASSANVVDSTANHSAVLSTEPSASTMMHATSCSIANSGGTSSGAAAGASQNAGNPGSHAATCSCSFVYRTYACSECRKRVQHDLQNLSVLLKLSKLRKVPAASIADLEEAVAATEDSGGDRRRDRMMKQMLCFHHVVLDEAGAMLEPDMIGTVIHGCRFLLCVGDHHQLPPFTQWKKAADYSYNVSLLQRLAQRPGVPADHNLMVMQYRMHPSIATIVSDTFYEGRLITAPSVSAARRRQVPVHFINVDGSEQSQGTSFKNTQEARTVVEIVRREISHSSLDPSTAISLSSDSRGKGNGTASTVVVHGDTQEGLLTQSQPHAHARPLNIDIIAFHKPQVYAIRDALEKSGLLRLGKIDVTTVDSMQGREADVVILSCVRSGDRKTLGFLTNRNRLNVALSRAREQMYIVGNRAALHRYGNVAWASVLGHANVLQTF